MHSETGQAPLARFLATGPPTLPSPAQLHEAFLWSQRRTVTKTATVSLHGNVYEVDAALVGRRVEVVFDPFDLTELAVRYQGRSMGTALPHRIGRHVHPDAHPETPDQDPAPATGIDYLRLVADRHTAALAEKVRYAGLSTDGALDAELASFAKLHDTLVDPEQIPGQLDLTALIDPTTTSPPTPPTTRLGSWHDHRTTAGALRVHQDAVRSGPTLRLPARRPADPAAADQARHLRRPRPADRAALRHGRHGPRRDQDLPGPPPRPGRPLRHPVQDEPSP